jgi:hypothetical protein
MMFGHSESQCGRFFHSEKVFFKNIHLNYLEPYSWLNTREAMSKIPRGERLKQPTGCPDSVFAVMSKCWEFEPEKRPCFVDVRISRLFGTHSTQIVENLTEARGGLIHTHPEWRKEDSVMNVYHSTDNYGEVPYLRKQFSQEPNSLSTYAVAPSSQETNDL